MVDITGSRCRSVRFVSQGRTLLWSAKDLPKTKLSDFIELKLSTAIEDERTQRASATGEDPRLVPGIDHKTGLVVRVVHDWRKDAAYPVDPAFRKLVVNTEGKTGYPEEIPCRQRVVALFQVRVHVCLRASMLAWSRARGMF